MARYVGRHRAQPSTSAPSVPPAPSPARPPSHRPPPRHEAAVDRMDAAPTRRTPARADRHAAPRAGRHATSEIGRHEAPEPGRHEAPEPGRHVAPPPTAAALYDQVSLRARGVEPTRLAADPGRPVLTRRALKERSNPPRRAGRPVLVGTLALGLGATAVGFATADLGKAEAAFVVGDSVVSQTAELSRTTTVDMTYRAAASVSRNERRTAIVATGLRSAAALEKKQKEEAASGPRPSVSPRRRRSGSGSASRSSPTRSRTRRPPPASSWPTGLDQRRPVQLPRQPLDRRERLAVVGREPELRRLRHPAVPPGEQDGDLRLPTTAPTRSPRSSGVSGTSRCPTASPCNAWSTWQSPALPTGTEVLR